jgi:hypothetical protein
MAFDTTTVSLLTSVLASSAIRDFFKDIARQRFGEIDSLRAKNEKADQELRILEQADLIGVAPNQTKYYVTAKGLKVARDLENLPVG